MSRHLRLSHTTYQCFWRCPVPSCPAWFASAFLGKDHLEEIHGFSEGHGWSFHEFLRRFGLEFGCLGTRCRLIVASSVLGNCGCLVRWSWREPHPITSRSLFLSSSLPADHLDQLLCRNSVLPTLKKKQNSYWAEIHPILEKWRGVNGSTCPVCNGFVKINMSRHLRLSHTTYQCFWRCPVPSCPAWFASAFLGKDHLEEIHGFSEGHGWSFHEFLRRFGLEWYGRRSFFNQRGTTGQTLWMDLALARQSGQELHNDYVITDGVEFGHLKRFFRAAVRALVRAFIEYPLPVAYRTVANGTVDIT